MTRLLMLDLDGTIRQNKIRPGDYINHPDEIELIPGVLELLQTYQGWYIVGISNQGGIEKNFTTLDLVLKGMKRTIELAPMVQEIYFCPQAWPSEGDECYRCVLHPEAVSLPGEALSNFRWMKIQPQNYRFEIPGFRKPNPGMLQVAIDGMAIKPKEILYVGDRTEDEKAAQAAGVLFAWADAWRNSPLGN